jgi:diguanylate cyclase (GGDEF)-like protein/PAS domain S-box-containing protein
LSFASPAAGRILGYDDASQLVGMNWADLLHPNDLDRAIVIRDELRAGTHEIVGIEAQVGRADGTWLWVEVQLTNLFEDEAVLGSVINFRDISERKRFEEQLKDNALHDPLTSLANRLLLVDRIDHANRRAARENTAVGLLFLDLDRFKNINDSQGHGAGDEVLMQSAVRLLGVVRPSDTVARFGGDEFVILVEDVTSLDQLLALADRVRIAIAPPFNLPDGRQAHTTVSIGIVESPQGDATPEALLRDADAAMYRAKAQGRDRYEVFDAAVQAGVIAHLETANALRDAIANDELRLHYQPIVEASSMQLVGFEALVRWQRTPGEDLVPPGDFISIAEDTGLIIPIGAWVLEQACRQATTWSSAYGGELPSISINLSIRQLWDAELTETLSRIIAATGIDARRITLEITESMLAENTATTLATLNGLKALGIHLSVDDFGTGYSSLAYLKRFPVDALKIDQTFVSDLASDRQATAIVDAIITLGHGLGLSVIAEGVETKGQLDELLRLGCDQAQGFYLGRPAPNDHWVRLAEKHASTTNPTLGTQDTVAR